MPSLFFIEQRLDYFSYPFNSEDQCILFFGRLYTSLRDCKLGMDHFKVLAGHYRHSEKAESRDYGITMVRRAGADAGLKEIII